MSYVVMSLVKEFEFPADKFGPRLMDDLLAIVQKCEQSRVLRRGEHVAVSAAAAAAVSPTPYSENNAPDNSVITNSEECVIVRVTSVDKLIDSRVTNSTTSLVAKLKYTCDVLRVCEGSVVPSAVVDAITQDGVFFKLFDKMLECVVTIDACSPAVDKTAKFSNCECKLTVGSITSFVTRSIYSVNGKLYAVCDHRCAVPIV